MEVNTVTFILLIIFFVSILFLIKGCTSQSGFTFNNSEYQYSNPDVPREQYYYKCLVDECDGDTHNYDCLQKCHLKSYRMGMESTDAQDWVCYPYANDENAFYKCLADVYSDYRYP